MAGFSSIPVLGSRAFSQNYNLLQVYFPLYEIRII